MLPNLAASCHAQHMGECPSGLRSARSANALAKSYRAALRRPEQGTVVSWARKARAAWSDMVGGNCCFRVVLALLCTPFIVLNLMHSGTVVVNLSVVRSVLTIGQGIFL